MSESARLRDAIEQSSWDGGWYRRAWFDDGSPLGTSSNAECRIDSIAQSWSVLSGASDAQRARMAMDAVDQQLVHRDAALIQLLDPPFDHSDPNPGYIQGYVRGVRENGGQYTHAAVWATMAFAALGDAERAWELFTMINPVNHAKSPEAIAVYKTEPYVLASDVYALAPHTGRGGWTWYTGSAGWMYQLHPGIAAGPEARSGQAAFCAVRARGLEFIPGALSVSGDGLPHYRAANVRCGRRAEADGRWRRTARPGHSHG